MEPTLLLLFGRWIGAPYQCDIVRTELPYVAATNALDYYWAYDAEHCHLPDTVRDAPAVPFDDTLYAYQRIYGMSWIGIRK